MEHKGFEIEILTEEAMKLLRVGVDELFATLGGQLLWRNLPSRTAGIIIYLSAVRSASEATLLFEQLPAGPNLPECVKGLNRIYDELREEGIRFFRENASDLQKAVCNEEMLRLSNDINRSTMEIIIMVVAATLRMPRELDPIAVTLANILIKIGLQNFCRDGTDPERWRLPPDKKTYIR